MLAFDVAGRDRTDLSVTVNEHSLVVRGRCRRGERPEQELRICTFPAPIEPDSIELERRSDVLTIQVRAKR